MPETIEEQWKAMTPADQARIIDALKAKKAVYKCPMCGHPDYTLAPWLVFNVLSPDFKTASNVVGPKSMIPAAALVCMNCGFLSQFAIGVLGLIDLVRPEAQK